MADLQHVTSQSLTSDKA